MIRALGIACGKNDGKEMVGDSDLIIRLQNQRLQKP